MRILFIQQDVCMYGASRSLLALIGELVKAGHSCCVLLPHQGPLTAQLDRFGITHAIVPWRGWTCVEGTSFVRRIAGGIRDWLYNKAALQVAIDSLVDIHPDLVHTNSSKTPFGAMLARKLGVPHVWHFREFLGGHFSCGHVFRFGHRLSQKIISKTSAAIVLISGALQSQFQFTARHLSQYVIFNGVMTSEEMNSLETEMPATCGDAFVLAFVGRLDSLKQPLVALEAIRRLRLQNLNIRLIVAGGGDDATIAEFTRFVQTHNLHSGVRFLGVVDDVGEVYRQCHALIMPSRGEAFGRVTAEAMAYGRPVIGAAAGATPELIEDGRNGLLFPVGDAEGLANAITRLAVDRSELRRMGANARETALRDFTNENYARSILQVYSSVLRTHSGEIP